MGTMRHPLPDNTLPMMTGFGQFGPIEMGGMFTVMKVREGLPAGDFSDPGPYRNPENTVAYELKGASGEGPRRSDNSSGSRELAGAKPRRKTRPHE